MIVGTLDFIKTPAPPTGFNLSQTGTYDYSSHIGATSLRGVYMRPNELSFFAIQYGGADDVFRFDMSSAFNITTMSYINFKNGHGATPQGITYGNSGGYYFYYNLSGNTILRLTTGTAYDNTSLSALQSLGSNGYNSTSMIISNDGTKIWLSWASGTIGMDEIALSVAYDLTSSITYTTQAFGTRNVYAFCFYDSGNKIMIYDSFADEFVTYPLSTAYDITTIGSETSSFYLVFTNQIDFYLNNDGTKMMLNDRGTNRFIQYDITGA